MNEFNRIKEQDPILFLDYDGTLVPIIEDPDQSYPDDELLRILDILKGKYELYIVTGRSLREIRTFLDHRYNVIALHGAVIEKVDGGITTTAGYETYRQVCDRIYARKDDFERRYPGIKVTNKDGGVVFTEWFVDPSKRQELENEVSRIASETGMSPYHGKMIVELRIPEVNKGDAIRSIRKGRPALIAGDDHTDEDAFEVNSDAISIKIGNDSSRARYSVDSYLDFRNLLGKL